MPLQTDPSKYEEVLYDKFDRDTVLRWYVTRAEHGEAVIEVAYTEDEEAKGNDGEAVQRDEGNTTTRTWRSDYNRVPDVYANYGRQPKPDRRWLKKDSELKHEPIPPVADIDADPFAYILGS